MKIFEFIILIGTLLSLSACTTSHVMVGKTRPATAPDQVKLYFNAPKKYEQIALVNSDSNYSFRFSGQGKVDAAIERAKKDAAKLGANGLLLQGMGEKGEVVVGSGTAVSTGTVTSGTMVGVSGGGLIKSFSALAIYVIEE